MHVILMLAILAFVLFGGLFLMCLYREKLNNPILDPLFIAATAVFFFAWNYAAYELGWLKDGFMTLENISPYICTVILFVPFLNQKIKDYAYCAIAFFSVGMTLALFVTPALSYLSNFRTQASFVEASEGSCHIIMGLYGFYLILSGRVKPSLSSWYKSVAFALSSVGFGVFLNWVFHRTNFGMNMHGKYAIYFLDIFDSFAATLLAYLLGIVGTLLLGLLAGVALDKLTRPRQSLTEAETKKEALV